MKEVLYLEGRLASLDRAYEQANGDSQEQAEILETKQLTKTMIRFLHGKTQWITKLNCRDC